MTETNGKYKSKIQVLLNDRIPEDKIIFRDIALEFSAGGDNSHYLVRLSAYEKRQSILFFHSNVTHLTEKWLFIKVF